MPLHTDLDADLEERARVLDGWVDVRRRIAALESEAAEILIAQIAIHDRDVSEHAFHRDAIYRSMVAEFSAAGRMPKGSIELAFSDARTLADALPSTRIAFQEGRITAMHVREIVRASSVISEAIRNKRADAALMGLYESAVLVVAEQDTAARTRPHARQVAAALVGNDVVQRERRAVQERGVTVRSLDDGLALLTAVLPEWIAHAIHDRLASMARQIVRARDEQPAEPGGGQASAIFTPARDTFVLDPDADAALDPDADAILDPDADAILVPDADAILDPDAALDPEALLDADLRIAPDVRTIDQIRADVFSDLLLTGAPSDVIGTGLESVRAHVQVTIAATTLAGIDDRPAELNGHGPLDPDVARALAGRSAGWARLFLDPRGHVRCTDSYVPTAGMKRHLRARDRHCRFPGCRMPVLRCQIDHNHDHAMGGATSLDNLAHLCVAHHTLKHPDIPDRHRWTARQLSDGTVTWTSPLGRSYADRATRRVMFV